MVFKGSPGKLVWIPLSPQQLCVLLSIPPVNATVGVSVMSPLPGRGYSELFTQVSLYRIVDTTKEDPESPEQGNSMLGEFGGRPGSEGT